MRLIFLAIGKYYETLRSCLSMQLVSVILMIQPHPPKGAADLARLRVSVKSRCQPHPEQLPIRKTLRASSNAGTAITHSFIARNAAKLKSALPTKTLEALYL